MSLPRPRALAAGLACAAALSGCGGGDGSGGGNEPMGWDEKQDETGISFALPVPVSGPEETRRPGRSTAVASRAYGSRSGDLTFAVQFLSTPESPGALPEEIPVERAPFVVIDQVRAEGDYDAEVLSNDRLEEADQPTYDARLRLSSADEGAVWWMRTRAFDEFVLVTQVVAFVEGGAAGAGGNGDRDQLEQQVETAFQRLNDNVEIPDSVE